MFGPRVPPLFGTLSETSAPLDPPSSQFDSGDTTAHVHFLVQPIRFLEFKDSHSGPDATLPFVWLFLW